jgi:arylsulfatase A-like enzyme
MVVGWRSSVVAIAGVAAVALVGTAAGPAGGLSTSTSTPSVSAQRAAAEPTRPNIVLITTDDQRLHDLRFMPQTRRLLVRQGTSFTGLSPHPLCCPARAELMSGQYAHNNGVRTNAGRWGGYAAFDETQTLATWLAAAGYRNIFLGKYLNGYQRAGNNGREPGWHSWHPTVAGLYQYWNFVVRHNAVDEPLERTYQTDYFSDLAVQQIRRHARSDRPFFLWQSFVAPHGACQLRAELHCFVPPPSAARHRALFRQQPLDTLSSPAFDEADMSDKPTEQQQRPRLSEAEVERLVRLNRARLRALRAVDEGIADMIAALARSGELDNTLVVFTSDNGFLMGQHRLGAKVWGYEESLRVPFVMRGPGIPVNQQRSEAATLLDIPATFVAMAGATPTLPLDGQNLMPIIDGASDGQDTVLILGGPRKGRDAEYDVGWFYHGVRTDRYTYIRYDVTGEEELYDRRFDPHQIASDHDSRAYARTLNELRDRTESLESCEGDECHEPFGEVPGPRW